MDRLELENNPILFGADPTERIVAVEPLGEDRMRLFFRRQGEVFFRDDHFQPFILVEDEGLLGGFSEEFRTERLSPGNPLSVLVSFRDWKSCIRAKAYLQKASGEPPSSPHAPYLFLSDPVHQFLIFTGKTFFKGMSFDELHRLAFDIETACAPGFEFSNPNREEDRILSIALRDNRGYEEVLMAGQMDEGEIIEGLGQRIAALDPDVIEGHNIFNFDLEYIVTRAKRLGLQLRWGRDGSEPRIRRSRFTVAERIIDYTRFEVFGRHVVDTLFLLQYYDVTARDLESYGLKYAARFFGLSPEDRVIIERDRVQWYLEHDPETLKRYNLADVRETLALSELLGYPFFLQTRIFPFSYQNIFVRGNATKINALFLREYIRRRASVPKPAGKGTLEGGYTDVFVEGVVRNVVHCDVASLYPSILLTYRLKPRGDILGIFPTLLVDLRRFRLEAKRKAQEARDPHRRDYYEALQQTFKVLINSFYGYLGTELHHFSDPEVAAEVTRRGREIIRKMIDWLRRNGATPVEIDTDGIYFVPPQGMHGDEEVEGLVRRLSQSLPEGIEVELDGFYRSMFSYKKKNYALLDREGKVFIKGSALRSRGMERFLREFLLSMITCLLEEREREIPLLYRQTLERLRRHEIPISWLAKTETLSESTEVYRQKVQAKKRNPSAVYELALASGRDYRPGDQVSYYVTGKGRKVRVYENCKLVWHYDPDNPDENIDYYEGKLLDILKKFKEFLPPDVLSTVH